MQTAMTRGEIAQFLEITEQEVEDLWTSGALQQSLCNPLRPDAGFAFSAMYDVLEYALSSGHLPVVLTKELAALWVCNLAEADEWDEFELADLIEQAAYLTRFAMEDGLHCRPLSEFYHILRHIAADRLFDFLFIVPCTLRHRVISSRKGNAR